MARGLLAAVLALASAAWLASGVLFAPGHTCDASAMTLEALGSIRTLAGHGEARLSDEEEEEEEKRQLTAMAGRRSLAVSWSGDANAAPGLITGTLTVSRSLDESIISHYNIYWADHEGGPQGNAVASIQAMAFRTPLCEGHSCNKIVMRTGEAGEYEFENRNYSNNENAIISASGPADIIVTHFNTEGFFDTLKVGDDLLAGSPELPYKVSVPQGALSIVWQSDSNNNGTGWSFKLNQTNARVPYRFKDVKPLASGLITIPVSNQVELRRSAVWAEVIDKGAE